MEVFETYLGNFTEPQQAILQAFRNRAQAYSIDIVEKMAYGLMGFYWQGRPFVYVGGFKEHWGVYALPSAHAAFVEKTKGFKQGKGSIQFRWREEAPWELIEDMLAYRWRELNSSST